MEIIKGILSNKTITVPLIAWFVAQSLKVVNVILFEQKVDFTRFVGSGACPARIHHT